jgi:hypothetical protein
MTSSRRTELHDLRIVEITTTLLRSALLVGVPLLVGHLLGWDATPGRARAFTIGLVLLGIAVVVLAGRSLLRFERRLRTDDHPSEPT